MNWSKRQSHILTGGGKLEKYYANFEQSELPHYHQKRGEFWKAFRDEKNNTKRRPEVSSIVGTWKRILFVGGWDYSDEKQETVVNMQLRNWFVDIRIPHGVDFSHALSLKDLSLDELRLFARRHAFSGFTSFDVVDGRLIATRHHLIDWNYVGRMRSRPNKWSVEFNDDMSCFKEWGWAKDGFDQSIYMEMWKKLDGSSQKQVALSRQKSNSSSRNAILTVCGIYFCYIEDRDAPLDENEPSLVDLVDSLLSKGCRDIAEKYLDLKAFHGTCAPGEPWIIKMAIQPWLVNTIFAHVDSFQLDDNGGYVMIENERWDIIECTCKDELKILFQFDNTNIIAKL